MFAGSRATARPTDRSAFGLNPSPDIGKPRFRLFVDAGEGTEDEGNDVCHAIRYLFTIIVR